MKKGIKSKIMSLIQIENLSGHAFSSFSSAYVADHISLEIKNNSTLGILGESGSGKTQLAMTIAGLNRKNYQMTEGCIKYNFDGINEFNVIPSNHGGASSNKILFNDLQIKLKNDKIYGNKIGFMFQDPGKSLNPYWTIRKHFDELIRTKKVADKNTFISRKKEIYKAFRLDPTLDNKYVSQLSGGQQQRVIVALVLLSEPDLIIADEIATGVDASVKRELLEYLLHVKHLTNSTLLIITHDIGFLLKIANRIVLMYKGSALQDLDADIVRSVLLTAQFKKQQELNTEKSNPDIKEKKPDEGLNLISQQLHPYLRELLRSYIYNVPLKGDIPNPTKKTGEACPFAERCVDRMDECTKTFPVVTTKPRSWVRCLKFEKTQ